MLGILSRNNSSTFGLHRIWRHCTAAGYTVQTKRTKWTTYAMHDLRLFNSPKTSSNSHEIPLRHVVIEQIEMCNLQNCMAYPSGADPSLYLLLTEGMALHFASTLGDPSSMLEKLDSTVHGGSCCLFKRKMGHSEENELA